MLRLAAYFFAVLALCFVLRTIPGIGAIFAVPFLGFFLAAAILSAVVSAITARAVDGRKQRSLERQLGATDTPHNQGKLGTLVLKQGRPRRALPHLERAARGEPKSAEWAYRLGLARLGAGDARGAAESLERSVSIDADHAFGAAQMRLAEARLAAGDAQGSLDALHEFERGRGETSESAFRRGLAQKALGRTADARSAFGAAIELAKNERFAHRGARHSFGWRARWRKLVT